MPEIVGPFNDDDFWVELWVLDKDNKYSQHVLTVSGGEYAGNYVNTNLDRQMWAGKYIFNLSSKGTNPNVTASPSRAYLTVNRASNNLEWNSDSPIIVAVGGKVDLGITYQADLWCTFNTSYDDELITLSSENGSGNNPHWYATGLKVGWTTLDFGIECMKNDMGFYNFSDSRTLSKRIKVVAASGINGSYNDASTISVKSVNGNIIVSDKNSTSLVKVYNLQGSLVVETSDNEISNLPSGLYIVNVENRTVKVLL